MPVDIVPGRDSDDTRAGFLGLRDDAQLPFNAPAPATFSRAEDLNRADRHDFNTNPPKH